MKDWIYKREDLVCKEWEPIMNAFIEWMDFYLEDEPSARTIYISYVKDKYSSLRMERSGGDERISDMINNIESLSYYLIPKEQRYG